MKSEKIKVIGISRVTIPSIFHPKAPYFVLLLKDENGNCWVQKSIKEYKIGQEIKFELSQDKNLSPAELVLKRGAVAIWRIKYDILEGIEKVVELLGGIDFNQDSKILILPTLISPAHPYFAENTRPQFLESLIKYLLERGAGLKNIKVVGQSFDEISLEVAAQKSQLLKVCQDYKIIPFDLAKINFVKKIQNNFTFEISEEVFNSDLIINLPILKVGEISAAENILKFLKKENYLGLKYLYSDEEILENLTKVLPNFLTIADAEVVQQLNKFTAFLGIILASFNPSNLDRVFAEICILKELPALLKKVKIEDIPIVGRAIEEVQYEPR